MVYRSPLADVSAITTVNLGTESYLDLAWDNNTPGKLFALSGTRQVRSLTPGLLIESGGYNLSNSANNMDINRIFDFNQGFPSVRDWEYLQLPV